MNPEMRGHLEFARSAMIAVMRGEGNYFDIHTAINRINKVLAMEDDA